MSGFRNNRFSRVNRDRNFHTVKNTDVLKIPRYRGFAEPPMVGQVGDTPGMEGNIILDRTTKQFCYHDGTGWVCLGATTPVVSCCTCFANYIAESTTSDTPVNLASMQLAIPANLLAVDGACVQLEYACTVSGGTGTTTRSFLPSVNNGFTSPLGPSPLLGQGLLANFTNQLAPGEGIVARYSVVRRNATTLVVSGMFGTPNSADGNTFLLTGGSLATDLIFNVEGASATGAAPTTFTVEFVKACVYQPTN